ncbi:hypothetical protein MRX96_003522 [Rhipicephalus microplus]
MRKAYVFKRFGRNIQPAGPRSGKRPPVLSEGNDAERISREIQIDKRESCLVNGASAKYNVERVNDVRRAHGRSENAVWREWVYESTQILGNGRELASRGGEIIAVLTLSRAL